MKSILYIGATIMIGASVYGFVDYKKTSRHREFTKMYAEPAEQKTVTTTTAADPVVVKTNEVNTTDPITVATDKNATGKTAVATVKKNKRRKIDYRSFSRAPIREEEIHIDKTIDEPKKVEIKEQ